MLVAKIYAFPGMKDAIDMVGYDRPRSALLQVKARFKREVSRSRSAPRSLCRKKPSLWKRDAAFHERPRSSCACGAATRFRADSIYLRLNQGPGLQVRPDGGHFEPGSYFLAFAKWHIYS
jgi:hypothetical protein